MLIARLSGLRRAVDRAVLHAQRAPGAVLHVELQGEAAAGEAAGVHRGRWGTPPAHPRQGVGLGIVLGADHAVRTDDRALAALDAEIRDPRPAPPPRCCASRRPWCRRGKVPSTGRALTGMESPSPASMRAVTFGARTRARRRAPASDASTTGMSPPARRFRKLPPRADASSAASTAAKFFFEPPQPPLRPYAFSIAPLMAAMASFARHHARDGEEAGLQHRC